MLQPGTLVEQLSPSQFASTFSTLKEISKEICIKLLLVYIIGLLGFRSNILVLHMYCTNYSAYIKAVPCIILLTKYIIQSYFVHFQSLFSLSLLTLNMVSKPFSCGLHQAESGVPPLLRVHGLSPEIANLFAVSAFLGILISELLFDSRTAPLDRPHQDLSIATRIGRIRPRTRPHVPPEVLGSPIMCARASTP